MYVITARDEMLSLTDMWKAAGSDLSRQPAKWRELPSSVEFIDFVCANLRKSEDELVKVVRGGNRPGTWAHWQIGLAYAKYLSPEFRQRNFAPFKINDLGGGSNLSRSKSVTCG